MISSLMLLSTIIILGAPSAVIFIPWAIITGNVLPLYNVTQIIVRTGYFLARIRVEVDRPRPRPAKHCLHLHGQPCLQSRSARAAPFHPWPHFRIPQTLADEAFPSSATAFSWANSFPSIAMAAKRARSTALKRHGAFSPRASTSPPSSKAPAPTTAACCPSRKARFISPWTLARRASPSQSGERRP